MAQPAALPSLPGIWPALAGSAVSVGDLRDLRDQFENLPRMLLTADEEVGEIDIGLVIDERRPIDARAVEAMGERDGDGCEEASTMV